MTPPSSNFKWFKRLLPYSLALTGGAGLYSANLSEQFYGGDNPEDSLGYQLLHAYEQGQEPMTASPKYGSYKFGSARSPEPVKTAGVALGKGMFGGMGAMLGLGEAVAKHGPEAARAVKHFDVGPGGAKTLQKVVETGMQEASPISKWLPALGAVGAAGGAAAVVADPLYDIAAPYIEAKGYELARRNTDIMTRAKMDQVAAESFAKTLGSEAAMGLTGLFGQGVDAATAIPRQKQYGDLFGHLIDTDPILGMSTPEQQELMGSAYQSMQRVSPTIAADPFATKNFLREVMVTGNGPDHATLGNLAKSEEAIRGRGGRR